jgi:hypothetical protein
MNTQKDVKRRSNPEQKCIAGFGKALTINLSSREESADIGEKSMFRLTQITKEEKPSVARTTDSFITETYEIENESDYQNEYDFTDNNIQDLTPQDNIHDFVIIECAGRFTTVPEKAGSWAFVALDENLDIIYEDSGEVREPEVGVEGFNDCFAVTEALNWALSLPKGNELFVVTDSKFVTEPHLHNCDFEDPICDLRSQISGLMSQTAVHSISLVPEEINHAAHLAYRTLTNTIADGLHD